MQQQTTGSQHSSLQKAKMNRNNYPRQVIAKDEKEDQANINLPSAENNEESTMTVQAKSK